MKVFQAASADSLSKSYYPPVAAMLISYPKDAIRTECLIDGELKGFGQLPPSTQLRSVETLGRILQRELVEAVDRYLRKFLINPNSKDSLVLGVRVWP